MGRLHLSNLLERSPLELEKLGVYSMKTDVEDDEAEQLQPRLLVVVQLAQFHAVKQFVRTLLTINLSTHPT
jgi:hypothetical protein